MVSGGAARLRWCGGAATCPPLHPLMASGSSEGGASGGGSDGGAHRRRRYSPPLLHVSLLLCGAAGDVGRQWLAREGQTAMTDSGKFFLFFFKDVDLLNLIVNEC